MSIEKLYIVEAKFFLRITSIALITWLATFLLSLMIGTFYIGHVPTFGTDKDPYSLDSFLLNATLWLNVISLFISFFSFFAWPLLTIHLLINKAQLTRSDRLLQAGALLSIIVFFLFKYIWTDQFLWPND